MQVDSAVALTYMDRANIENSSTYSHVLIVIILSFDTPEQILQTKIRLIRSDKGLQCLPFDQHLITALLRAIF